MINSCDKQRLQTEPLSHRVCFTPFVDVICSASIIDKEKMNYKISFQLITHPKIVKT